MGRRTALLLAAIVIAAFGTFAVWLYADKANDRALEDQKPVKVLVASELIQAGTTAEQAERNGSFELKTLARDAVVNGAISDLTSVQGKQAVGDIFPGEQILPGKFGEVGSTGALPIPAGKLAMSVQLGDPQRVAGFISPGSEVAVFVTLKPEGVTGAQALQFTQLLFARVPVLAVGPTTLRPAADGRNNTEALPTAILTLGLDQAQAQRLAYATQSGTLYVGLLSKESKVSRGSAIDIRNLFSG
jgi:pilus assembly protein CpaB